MFTPQGEGNVTCLFRQGFKGTSKAQNIKQQGFISACYANHFHLAIAIPFFHHFEIFTLFNKSYFFVAIHNNKQ